MREIKYILDKDGNPVPEPDVLKWGKWFEKADRKVANTNYLRRNNKTNFAKLINVSTVFLGLDHCFSGRGKPILYETMIFGGSHDSYQERYTNKIAALAGHDRACAMIDKRFWKEKK
jgi:hypothetical protein